MKVIKMVPGVALTAIKNLLLVVFLHDATAANELPVKPVDCDNCTLMSVSTTAVQELDGLDIFYVILLACVIVASVLGNGIVGLVLYRKRTLSPSSKLVFSLCSSNFCVSLAILPFSLASAMLKVWVFGQHWCWLSSFLIHVVVSASNVTLAAIAIDRYYAIVKPMSYASIITSAKCLVVLLAIWVISLLVNLPPLFGWPLIYYEPSLSVCLPSLESNSYYSGLLLVWDVLLPAVIMTTAYGCIFQVARSKYKKTHIGTVSGAVRHSEVPINSTVLASQAEMQKQPNLNRHYVRKPSWLSIVLQSPVKGFAVICSILGIFYLCWSPYIATMFAMINHALSRTSWQRQLAYYILILSMPSYPIIYGLLNRSIRKDVSIWLGTRKTKSEGGTPKAQFRIVSSVSTSNSSAIVGILDYTPPFSQWQFSTKRVKLAQCQRKSSEDSGRFSMPLDESDQSANTTITSITKIELLGESGESSSESESQSSSRTGLVDAFAGQYNSKDEHRIQFKDTDFIPDDGINLSLAFEEEVLFNVNENVQPCVRIQI